MVQDEKEDTAEIGSWQTIIYISQWETFKSEREHY